MYPIFITDEPDAEVVINSLPGQKRWGINKVKAFLEPLVAKGLASVMLFGVPVISKKVVSSVSRWQAVADQLDRTREGH